MDTSDENLTWLFSAICIYVFIVDIMYLYEQNLDSLHVVNFLIHLTSWDQSNCHIGLIREGIKIKKKKKNS